MIAQMPMNINPNETQTGLVNPSIPPRVNNDAYFAELANLLNVRIIQKAACIEFLYPQCVPNRYEVVDPNGRKMYELKEKSECCERCCCFPFRSFDMFINNITSVENNTSVSMEGSKNCAIPIMYFCGCGKPTFEVEVNSPIGFRIGSAKLNYNNCLCYICENRIDILDSSNSLRYIIKSNCCCLGYYLCHFTKCCDCSYNIIQNNQTVGTITKDTCNGAVTFCTNADNYSIAFPLNATPQDKMLLICGALLIDYLSYYL